MDNITKIRGKHVFKFGFYFQSASNASNSQTHVESDIDFTANASNPLNTGNPFANALLGVYNSYTQANAKPYQNYLYHDLSWYVQDTWKVTPRLTLDLGVRFSWYQPVFNSAGDGELLQSGRCSTRPRRRASTGRCASAPPPARPAPPPTARIDPAVSATPTLTNTQPGFYVGKLVPNSGNFTNGLILASAGLSQGRHRHAQDSAAAAPRLRLGRIRQPQDRGARRLRHHLRPLSERHHRLRRHQSAVRPEPHLAVRLPAGHSAAAAAASFRHPPSPA